MPAEEIPDLVKAAFISAEDKNFYQHSGYDLMGIASAARDAVVSRGRNVRGASTITQQVMKNFLLSGDRQAERKIKEIILAARLEETLEKEQILELYMNEIYLGQNSYGVTAAAQTYFNKTLDELAPHEAAFLASLPKAPSDSIPCAARSACCNGAITCCAGCSRTGISIRRPMTSRSPNRCARSRTEILTASAPPCRRGITLPMKSGAS